MKIQIARLRNKRQEKPIRQPGLLVRELAHSILIDTAVAGAYGGVCDDDGRVQQPRFIQAVRAGHFAGAVEAEVARVAGPVEPVAAGEDGSNACVYGEVDT
ncbi:hypothetical protein ACJ73_01519 [Blastomyces percursus]|uniref:Uncharacterized protein n=1 Tax=Blastomyces percursus TaxID=1658174 RepID=A0A1J9RES0_9EURO|nr:hypothetical protein ACJ73_01519 [Blastomyces percursus]